VGAVEELEVSDQEVPKLEFYIDDTLVIEVQNIADQIGLSFQDTVSLLVGLGMGYGHEQGMFGPRVTEPMTPEVMFRKLAEAILR
jgi:hypothetical protein